MLLSEACQGSEFARAGISDQDIDLPLRLHVLVEAIEVLQFGDVSPNACNLSAYRLDGLVEFLLAATRMKTQAPSSTNRFAVAKPIPVVPPVTTATFPCNLPIIVSPFADESRRRSSYGPDGRLLSRLSKCSDLAPQGEHSGRVRGRYASFLLMLTGSEPAPRSMLRSPPPRRRKKSGRGLRRRIRYAASPTGSRGIGTGA